MGTWIEGLTHFFVCDVCNDRRTTVKAPWDASFDEVRAMSVDLNEAGWRITKKGKKIEVLCPDCAQYDGYKMGPDALDDL